jgi:hypothetical protein
MDRYRHTGRVRSEENKMSAQRWNKLATCLVAVVLSASPAFAQTKLVAPMSGKHVVDNCAPIGQTAKHELVYSMKCDNLPAPPPVVSEAPPQQDEPETRRTGLFGMSFDRRPQADQPQQ